MIVRLLAPQIPIFWETIKLAVVQADEVDEQYRSTYLNNLLHNLLNDKNQCFVRLNAERRLLSLAVTKIGMDKSSGIKCLFIQILYSWKLVDDQEWKKDWVFLSDFARKSDCVQIVFESRAPRIWQLGEMVGFRESSRTFSYKLEA